MAPELAKHDPKLASKIDEKSVPRSISQKVRKMSTLSPFEGELCAEKSDTIFVFY